MDKKIAEYKKEHPIGQSFHSGLYGFQRYRDCLDLSGCVYPTLRQAQLARARAAENVDVLDAFFALRDFRRS
jgi:hypothetical protein